MDTRKCWELKTNCLMRGRSHNNAGCPAYRALKSCWEIDWRKVIQHLPASQQEYWYEHMDRCPSCIAYKKHSWEMQERIKEMKSFYLND
jgi:hypothetical protein